MTSPSDANLADPPSGVGGTSLGVARIRAAEHRRPGRLFDDRFAAGFVSASPRRLAEDRGAAGAPDSVRARFARNVVLRTRFFDDYLVEACGRGCDQVVLLAAGLDARAFRLPFPSGSRLFELDLPDVLAFKDRVLAEEHATPRCQRVTVPADLRTDWASRLRAAGFDVSSPTAWLAEGLLVYLTAAEADRLLTTVGELSAAGSTVAFERGSLTEAELRRALELPGMSAYTALWQGGLDEDAESWLVRHGWSVTSHERAAVADRYGLDALADTGTFLTATMVGQD